MGHVVPLQEQQQADDETNDTNHFLHKFFQVELRRRVYLTGHAEALTRRAEIVNLKLTPQIAIPNCAARFRKSRRNLMSSDGKTVARTCRRNQGPRTHQGCQRARQNCREAPGGIGLVMFQAPSGSVLVETGTHVIKSEDVSTT